MGLTVEKIRSLCTEDSFKRGLKYFEEGRVKQVDFFGDTITAVVQGAENYRVTIRVNEDIEGRCSCPYDWGGYCKHVVATLILYSQGYEKLKGGKEREEGRVNAVLSQITVEKLKEFLSAEFEKDPKMRARFLIYFTGEGEEKSLYDYKKEISQLYQDAAGRHGFIDYDRMVDFSYVLDVAERYIEKRNFLEAAKIFQALSEAIAENMDMVDDSSGDYGGEFDDAMERLVTCLKEAGLGHGEKRPYIDYLFRKFIEGEPDYFQENYDHALRQMCTSEEDLRHWKNLLEPHLTDLPDSEKNWEEYYDAEQILMMQIFVLEKLGEEEELHSLLEKNYRRDRDLCLLFAERLLRDGELTRSMEVAEEGLSIFPDRLASELRTFLIKFYKENSLDKYRENLKNLFLLKRDWGLYDELKRGSSKEEWGNLLGEMVKDLSKRRGIGESLLIDVYLREGMFDEALREVLATGSLDMLSRYRSVLSARYPEEYFNAYKELLIPFAAKNVGRRHYREVVAYLEWMREIEVCESEFKKLVESLKEKYSNRPAFLTEMRQLNERR
jgi:hypothetical protein